MGLALPVFDLNHPRGFDFTQVNSPTPQKYLIETMGGGVALFDYNNDGLLDISECGNFYFTIMATARSLSAGWRPALKLSGAEQTPLPRRSEKARPTTMRFSAGSVKHLPAAPPF